MNRFKLDVPVVFIIFNRPDRAEKVFAEIRKAKPPKLLVVADGPRSDRPGESEQCAITRRIIERVDWECEVIKNFAVENLGCKQRVSSGLDWAFNLVEAAIILEDDCLPDPSFFRFCQELLERYRDDERIMMISGDNMLFSAEEVPDSYYFSRFVHIWGWATWRRAWGLYDLQMKNWWEIENTVIFDDILKEEYAVKKWRHTFTAVANGEIDTWDYQWVFACWTQNGLSIVPHDNLISNIGFGEGATHTSQLTRYANMRTSPMLFPLQHPVFVSRNLKADMVEIREEKRPGLCERLRRSFKKRFGPKQDSG